MKTFRLHLCVFSALGAALASSYGQAVFTEDFEGGLGAWVNVSATYPVTIATDHNIMPEGGTQSAFLPNSASRIYHNLGTEVSGVSHATWYLFDDSQTRVYGEVRSHTGAGYNDGTLQNLFAAGKYSSVTLPGETFDATKYQARISATGYGWFNLNAEGAPTRSPGWHPFDVERAGDGTTVNFYVDGILGRSFTGITDYGWDTVVLGFGTSTTVGNAWMDGISVQAGLVPEPSTWALLTFGGFSLALWRLRRRD